MAGQKGRSGSGGKRKGAGRPKGAVDAQPRFRIAKSLALQKWEFAKRAQPYADRMLDVLVAVAENVEAPEAARISAADKVLDRALGTGHVDVTALHHTEIVYRSAAQIRQELIDRGVPEALLDSAEMRQELLNRGVPEVLLDYSPKDSNDSNDE
jgi:ABC-type taurine transport system substrate-binding protein